jgi:hypothetical protein
MDGDSGECKEQNNPIERTEAEANLLGFFELLILIDRRMHPERYTKKGGDENLIF